MNAKNIYEWGKAVAVIGGAISTVFVLASGAMQKINAVPGIQKDVAALTARVDRMDGELEFIVQYVEDRTGRKYTPAPASR